MDVLVVARHPGGGIRTYFSYVYGHESMRDVGIHLLTPHTPALKETVRQLHNCHDHIETPESLPAFAGAIWKTLKARRPDLIHSHGFTAGLMAAIPARILGIPHVITTHDVFLDNQFFGLSGALKKRIIGRVMSLATIINPVGEDARTNLLETYPYLKNTEKVVGIRNGIASSRFLTSDARDLRTEAGVSPDTILIGFFGRFMAQKGFRCLVDAVDRWNGSNPQRYLNVACFGWGGFIREEQAELKDRRLDRYFHFFPQTDDMAVALRGVDVVVMPSRWEACPLLPMEAMVAGVPVIGTRCIGLREVAEDTPVMLFDVNSVEQLAESLYAFSSNEQEIKAGADGFRREAAERFDVSNTALELRELYRSIVQDFR